MKLTKSDREAFVAAVLNDVPSVDYNDQAQKLVRAELETKLPDKVLSVLKDKTIAHYIEAKYVVMPGKLQDFYTAAAAGFEKSDSLIKALEQIDRLDRVQTDALTQLREKVAGVIGACTTLKQAIERLPEFTQYLPANRDESGLANLPVISNVVAELVQAGWPKDKQSASKKKTR